MRLHLAFALIWVIAYPASGWAQSAPISDTVLRAAYCLGVLSEAISWLPKPDEKTKSEIAKGTATALDVEVFNGVNELIKIYEQKRQRYFQYLSVKIILEEMPPSILAIGEKGKSDHRRKAQGLTAAELALVPKCRTSCGDAANTIISECSIQCVAKEDQVYANVIKCTTQPDQLPF
jgi:hypothetical protein